METYLLDWANLLLRWLHVIVGIAWIGSSFYFVFLDSSLTPPEDEQLKKDGVSGELWALHGGGFYHPVKFAGAPPKLPEHLHWFYWESYSTWLSGFALFLVSYLWSPSVYLIDPRVMQWSPGGAIAAALAFLVVFWLLYDAICRTLGQSENGDAKVGALVLVLVCIAAYAATQMFAGRAAFLLMGAMLATSMSANVFFWIIPGQRTMVADMKAGRPVDPIHGKRGKQRSVHNTYFTLPVLFAMLSNHYSFTYSHPQNWLVLIGMMFAGAAIRQFFVMRHGFKLGRNPHPWKYAAVGVVVLLALIVWLKPANLATSTAPKEVGFVQVQPVFAQRCVMCHGEAMQSKGVRLDSPAEIKKNAQMVYQQAVVQKTMPMNNATAITDEERALIGQWFNAGAKTE
ncbi:urate hydroxylase PuuD [Hydrogenophaga sp. RWCD_12]|uniref:urate hydroxylase PuuD n=1 Tax=Hydrogenophaga sp. RWCD_12 TaxID=3391190 RepID=UPI0039854AB2